MVEAVLWDAGILTGECFAATLCARGHFRDPSVRVEAIQILLYSAALQRP